MVPVDNTAMVLVLLERAHSHVARARCHFSWGLCVPPDGCVYFGSYSCHFDDYIKIVLLDFI